MAKKEKKAKGKRAKTFDLLEITESLGYQIHRKNGRNSWSKEEDEELRVLISDALKELGYPGGIDSVKTIHESVEVSKRVPWESLAQKFRNELRTAKDLRKRWTGSLDPNLKKGRWTKEEDEQLIRSYEKFGAHWLSVSLEIDGRTEDQCAKRYIEVLGPGSKGRLRAWSLEEDLALISKVKAYGTKWRKISSEMEFRPSLTCRNRWRKIITMVVRDQADEAIVKAVKENKDIDLSQISRETKGEKLNMERKDMIKSSKHIATSSNSPIMDGGRSPSHNNVTNNKSVLDRLDTTALHSLSNSEKHSVSTNKQLPSLSELTPSPGFLENMNHPGNSNPSMLNPHNTKILEDSLSPLVRATGLILDSTIPLDKYHQRQQATPIPEKSLKSDGITHNISDINLPSGTSPSISSETPNAILSVPAAALHTQTEWKFTLKDRKGLSISNGLINNSELVRELIDQARKYSLKISVHQHIHNHYGGSGLRNSINSKMSDQNASTASSSNSKGLSPASIVELYQNPYMVKSAVSLPEDVMHQLARNQDPNFHIRDQIQEAHQDLGTQHGADDINFLTKAQTPNYPSLEFGPSPNVDNKNIGDHLFYPHVKTVSNPAILTAESAGSNSTMTSPHFSNVGGPNRVSPHSLKSDGSSSMVHTTPGSHGTIKSQTSDIPDVGPSRFSHFNYLPPTIRPQLGSSETGNSDLNKILNPSPLSSSTGRRKRSISSKHKHSKLRKKGKTTQSESSKPYDEGKTHSISRRTSRSKQDYSSDDGIDFWEKLRSLDRHGINADSSTSSSVTTTSPEDRGVTPREADVPPSEEEDSNDPFYYLNPS
ncbi:similar to Saccharomyces cerevisiae YKR099W BAS1 Myb-related transcription factor involved in regulating basal and induced expression of genes of the purine and histidine biosynthesis pathways [Maudiozyma barnettii]|uniref:Similar to Saccharomyces cerevisiae YKR099W BAS1 Myb-related transcription factor involved in regulating basal and induced expression of genes of the purine and histidine biosynthesis pathways n=1 Tax=Maudiozyma barnettii TaxID=61262 RepID=A0A8H2ZJJ5_9SACH|nr:Bas1p [Kazachstania barnettii]CAB4256053.1 similar to Saccharomyces cerevisiae YKR099W BAS1 Myb-related transcription factor involved in regulating basal and induced expression of genes of the purine and histidine biosynthesis pathways [Kazachstania barnettii]CAD1784661.1 similar to Saccharomyces cerevisiae YKR099W BAS1 Myb-related transcription factor involved in regulating basal and induced expression of genes of the purine and histidine biosynthesis pathways [Kazachstania barnettii]